ncbi:MULTISPECIES: ABC transporter ATP-binding protein [Brevibacillus]|uniref:ABC transporter ATP-binding protein n=1 Tax=Brevibacillus TaxID=55080 RepID=UPI000D0F4623|nr:MULTISPECIES: ABC transporter ATP-binding protein [Brevibacillus]PSJ71168.1 Fe3+/spermidine/putrescine ABC transporter ATP-binding protein [Brevibacillus brevis]RED28769.1 putative spermidine/putrescine transport system ATP-binding protein [Brevibacillus brevis]TQK62120.1 putative spermidine/putrescine transport system ATP-binding protein [Brevibacillus sp. AG162]VEF91636.1 Maltose/maltodextrin import ATP-binding protein MalK [Brevibacillus brevis]GEC89773.1 polyamine ABC transporter ATP-bi
MTKVIDVELRGIMKKFQSNVVVQNFNLQVEQGEFISFLGPSGCGKTTTLNMIAGFLDPDGGDLLIKGQRMNGVPPYKRELGMVFQTYSLFPHMTVAENIAYGLKLRKVNKQEMQERVNRVLSLVKLPNVADRYPKQLSGGQRQRIAIARALVIEPSLLLLDEPLSNLDAKLREELRDELKRLHHEIGVTTIFVTHDQEEALALSDRIVVMNHGFVEQIGTPLEIYNQPASEFVHTFIGKTNRLEGEVIGIDGDVLTLQTTGGMLVKAAKQQRTVALHEKVIIFIRPEKIKLTDTAVSEEVNRVKGHLQLASFLGSYTECEVKVGEHTLSVKVQMTDRSVDRQEGQTVYCQWNADDVLVMPAGRG